jgi:proteasome accessory factor C
VSTPKQLARLLALVPYLLARPQSPLDEVAATFGITREQLDADLKLVWFCGLPGQLPGDLIEVDWEGDAVTLSNADTIARPLRLRADEAAALLVGLRTLHAISGLDAHDAVERALAKVETAAGDAAAGARSVAVDVEVDPDVVGPISDALERRRALHLRYYVPTRDEATERDVDPIRLLVVGGRTYLEAWCRSVDDVRRFRLDRILDVAVLDEAAAVPAEAMDRAVSDRLFEPSPDDATVTLELEPAGRWVAEYYPCESVEEIGGGRLRVTLRTPDTRWVRRLALRLGASGRVIDPGVLAAEVRSAAGAALANY